jgi:hypothetical protein
VILKSARAQDEARRLANEGKYDAATKLMRETAWELRGLAPTSDRTQELLTQAEEIEGYGRSMAEGAFDAMQSKSMRYSSWQKQRGRPRRDPGASP